MEIDEKITFKIDDGSQCYICTSHAKGKNGYHKIKRLGKTISMHRYVFSKVNLNGAPIPNGLVVRHKCDNKWCINPLHLESGTQKDNMNDMSIRGRSTYGEKSASAKINATQAKEIYESNCSQTIIAKKYGISQVQVSRIKRGEKWGNLLK